MSQQPPESLPRKSIKEKTLVSLMRRSFSEFGWKNAIEFLRGGNHETTLSYGQLDSDSDTMARKFLEMGVSRGDRVVIYLPKCPEWVVAHIAILKIGAISVPLNPAFKRDEMGYFLDVTKPRLAVVGHKQKEVLRNVALSPVLHCVDDDRPFESSTDVEDQTASLVDEPNPDDPALIVFTSGTTGKPKGAVLTQANLSHDARNVSNIWEIDSRDRFCHALPLFHVHGLCFGMHSSLIAGTTLIMLDSFDPKMVRDVLAEKDTTIFMAVPTMYARLIDEHPAARIDYSHLRLLTSGSAPLLEQDFERIRRTFGLEPVEREGMSETLMNFSNPVHGKRKPGSIGLPLPCLEVRIVDPESFRDVEAGHIGEIWLKGPAITPGYWENSEETNIAFREGWFRTGDLGKRDNDGYYYLTDRIKNIIISGGENVSPREIESLLNTHDDVAESCVVGLPDKTWGEIVAAAVVLKPDTSTKAEDLKTYCRERILDWKCPKRILIAGELPRNQMGKVLRNGVQRLFMD